MGQSIGSLSGQLYGLNTYSICLAGASLAGVRGHNLHDAMCLGLAALIDFHQWLHSSGPIDGFTTACKNCYSTLSWKLV